MYPHSPLIVKIIIRAYIYATCLSFFIFKRVFWPVRVPSYMWVRHKSDTTKEDYWREKRDYRIFHDFEKNDGDTLKEIYYYYYRTIAQKYNWPYIQEVYDDFVYEPQPVQTVKLPSYSPIKAFVGNHAASNLELKLGRNLWWVIDAVICVLTVGNFLVNDTAPTDSILQTVGVVALLVVFLQIFFVPPYVLIKLSIWLAKRGKHRLAN